MVVSDGMGGAAAGEIASAMAVKTLRDALIQEEQSIDTCSRLKLATERANDAIWEHSRANRQLAGMGATVTAVLIHNTGACIAQVGDSRAYLIRGHEVKQLTKDQSLVQLLIDSGAIRPEQSHTVPNNVIMQALGTSPTVDVAMASVELYKDDLLLVCTDGLSNKVSAIEMRDVLRRADSLNAACRDLVTIANQRGGEDNITVIAARFDGEALHSAAESNSITGSIKILTTGSLDQDLARINNNLQVAQESSSDLSTRALNAVGLDADPKAASAMERQGARSLPLRGIVTFMALALCALLIFLVLYLFLHFKR